MKRPAFQFYPADWRKDSNLQSSSIESRGLWIDLLCIMHECDRYGHLSVNNKAMNSEQIARLVGISTKDCKRLLIELEDAGVFSRLEDSTIYSRRMVKDERLRTLRAEAGRLGGNPVLVDGKDNCLLNQKDNQEDKQKDNQEDNHSVKQNLTPSARASSSSSSTSKAKSKTAIPAESVFPEIEDRQVVDDWLAVRRAKNLPVTKTALSGIEREAAKAGMTHADVLRLCCEKSWGSFSSKWIDQQQAGSRAASSSLFEGVL